MNIQPHLLLAAVSNKTVDIGLSGLLKGHTLNATITARTNDSITLKINNQIVETRSQKPLALNVGQQINLKVERQSNPTILKIIDSPVQSQLVASQKQLTRESLPRQQGLETLIKTLNQQLTGKNLAVLPQPLQRSIQQIINQLPSPAVLIKPDSLAKAVQQSGLFLEARLKKQSHENTRPIPSLIVEHNKASTTSDLKAQLLKISTIIKQTQNLPAQSIETANAKPSEKHNLAQLNTVKQQSPQKTDNARLIDIGNESSIERIGKQVEASLARVELNQARSIPVDNSLSTWLIETPIKDRQDIDLLQLDIEQQSHQHHDANENSWTVDLNIEMESVGTLSARINMYEEDMNITLWSDQGSLKQLLENNISKLDTKLKQKGLIIDNIYIAKQTNDEYPERPPLTPNDSNLINVSI